MATIRVNGVRLAYDEAGSGPAVVFSHAALADRRMWEHQFRALSDSYRVIRYDWRGYGESDDAEGEFTRHGDLIGLLDALDVPRATLVGCSMGGAYSVDVALTAPERVSGLVLICSGLSGHVWPPEIVALARERIGGAVPAERLARYHAGNVTDVDPEDVRAMARAQVGLMVVGPDRDFGDLDPAVARLALDMCEGVFRREWAGPPQVTPPAGPPAGERLSEVDAPTLVINGLADVPGIQEVSGLLAKGIRGARRIDLPDTGHLPPLERAEAVTEALREFLAGQN